MAGVVLNKMSLANLVIRLRSLSLPLAWEPKEPCGRGRKEAESWFLECEKISVINFKRLKIYQYIGIRWEWIFEKVTSWRNQWWRSKEPLYRKREREREIYGTLCGIFQDLRYGIILLYRQRFYIWYYIRFTDLSDNFKDLAWGLLSSYNLN